MLRRSFLGLLALALLAGACAPEPYEAPPPGDRRVGTTPPALDLRRLEAEVHTAVEAARRRHRVRILTADAHLAALARRHSADMAQNGYFDHINRQGENPRYRARKAGIRCGIGENLFVTYQYHFYQTVYQDLHIETRYTWKSEREIAAEAVRAWLESPLHRAALLSPDYTMHGIGVAANDGLRIYVTQNLC